MYNINPIKMAIQKFMMEMLKDRYLNHHQVIERMCHYLVTEQDVKQFGSLIADVYQLGFLQASRDYTQKLAEQGFSLEIIDSKTTDDDQTGNN
jgi:hypothetical protein